MPAPGHSESQQLQFSTRDLVDLMLGKFNSLETAVGEMRSAVIRLESDLKNQPKFATREYVNSVEERLKAAEERIKTCEFQVECLREKQDVLQSHIWKAMGAVGAVIIIWQALGPLFLRLVGVN